MDIPPIINDGVSNTVFNWFTNPNGTGIYPLIVFINHELVINRIMGTSPSPTMANLLIENMLNNCSEGFDCNGNCGGIVTLDECGVCGGSGAIFECGCTSVTEGACDCNGNIPDCAGICGGTAQLDECSQCNEPICNDSGTPSPFTEGKNPCQVQGEYPISTLWNSTCDPSLSLNNISISLFSKGEQKSKCMFKLTVLFIIKIISTVSSVSIFKLFEFKYFAKRAFGLPNK